MHEIEQILMFWLRKVMGNFLTSVFRKSIFLNSTFDGIRFGPTKRKTDLIETPVH